ncbi:MAG TPA: AAA family ATPase [Candidatus Dormibacteraeota bacterium]
MASIDIPFEAVRAQIASAVNLIVHQARMPDGRRKIAQIAEVVGYDSNGAILRDIFNLGMGSDLRLEYNATGYVPTSLDKAAFYGVQVDRDLFDPVKARFVPAGSDSMMPVVKDPMMSGQRGGGENVVRQVVVVPFSSDRPGDSRQQQTHTVQSSDTSAPQTMQSTPEMQDEMRKLIDAARSAVADLQAAAPAASSAPPPRQQAPQYEPQPHFDYPQPPPAQPGVALPPELIAAAQAALANPQSQAAAAGSMGSAENAAAASQALQAATAMARASTALGNMAAAASSGFAGMLPITHSTGPSGTGASRRIQAVVESLITRKGLNLRLAPAITQAFEGAELKASDYAAPNKLSKESASRELRQAVESGLLQLVKYPQGEAGFRADPGLLRQVAEGLGQPVNASQALTPETIISSLSAGQSEGTVTIMFTDVENSTQMLSSKGFTVSHEIMKAYESIMEEKITEHAGRRIKGLGDGVMVSFGSTRHAVECAIEIQRAIADYSKQNPERKLKIRIGINTGEVVEEAGDIFGAAVNVAARVAGKAKGGEILVSEVVRELVGPVSEMVFGYRGRFKLKGFPDRFRLHDVTPGEAPSTTPIISSGDGFVGREQERLDIRMALDRAATGSGGIIFIAGAPGMGATRLAAEVAAESARKGWWVLSGRCAEQDVAPLGPFREVLAAAVASTSTKALQEAVGTNGPLLAQLAPGLRQKVRGMGPHAGVPDNQLREQLFRAVFEFLTECQGSKPLMILLDDLQWADDETVLLLRDIAERLGGSRVIILGTYWESELDSARPFTTAASRLLRRRRAQRIALGRLSDREVEKMIAGLGDTPLTPVQIIGIQAATEGNPLFIEHSYLYMAESETMLAGRGRVQASFSEEDLELANSVRGIIGRRLERLSEPAQRMLVAAAVIGRDFDIPLLEAFGELSGHELRDAIDEATRAHFLHTAGENRYRFSHDLVRQRVIAVLPLPRQQAYHLAVADTLERSYGKSASERAAEIAHHLYQAGTSADPIKTSSFLAQAAKNAMAVGAFEEALRLIERTLQLLPGDNIRERAEALAIRGQAYWGLARNSDAKAAWTGALGRYEELGDTKSASDIHGRLHEIGADGAVAATQARPQHAPPDHEAEVVPEPAPDRV